MKKSFSTAVITLLAGAFCFAQAADDGFIVPLDEDFTKVQVASSPVQSSGNSKILQGAWIEVTGDSKALIRDIAKGTKKGWEFDNAHFLSNMNWWFWGDINESFHLDAEISVWDFDKTLYQSSTYASNVPDVTWGDGLQSVSSLFFAPLKEGNDESAGTFNKLGLNLTTPYVNFRVGSGNLKKNGMIEYTGIYTVIDRWLDTGDGFFEVSNGSSLKSFGKFNINAVAALSEMKNQSGYPYGTYELLDVNYDDRIDTALTFGSATTENELFYYNRSNINAASAYTSLKLTDSVTCEGHGLVTFGTDVNASKDSEAASLRVKYSDDKAFVSLMGSWAGEDADSVWGSDGQDYDNICADSITSQLDLSYRFNDKFSLSLDEHVSLSDTSDIGEGLMSIRSQPQLDYDISSLTGKSIVIGAYAAVNTDRLSSEYTKQNTVVYFNEGGLEVNAEDLPLIKKLTFDYGVKRTYTDNITKDGYDWSTLYNSVMVNADVSDRLNVHLGSLFNLQKDKEDTFIPCGIAVGFSVKNVNLPGKPSMWMHFAYAMNPYEDNNYTLFRADDELNKTVHRTYMLNTVDTENASRIALGLIWNL